MPPQKRYLENDTRPKKDKKVFPVPCYGVIVASFEPYLGFVSPWRMMRLWNTPNFRLGTKCRGPSLGVVGNSLGLVVLFDHLGFFPPLKELGWVGLGYSTNYDCPRSRASKRLGSHEISGFDTPWHCTDSSPGGPDKTSFPSASAKIDQLFLKSSRCQRVRESCTLSSYSPLGLL